MPLLYYWRPDNYGRDLDNGAGYHLNQSSPRLHAIEPGDSLWAFTRNREGSYVLTAELVVHAKTFNQAGYRYGRFRLWGNLRHSRYFQTPGQMSIEPVVRSLSITTRAKHLGQAFQGHAAVRAIALEDHQTLTVAAINLQLEPRARLFPEERLEALMVYGDGSLVEAMLSDGSVGFGSERRAALRQVASRNRALVEELRSRYEGRCQLCAWSPLDIHGEHLCEAHHIRWLSRGGDDALDNMMLLCPNDHRAVHKRDAVFDYHHGVLLFGGIPWPLKIDNHLCV